MHKDHPDTLVGARNGSPLILGIGENEMFLASDVTAMISYTKQVVYIEDGEIITVTPDSFRTSGLDEQRISKKVDEVDWECESFDMGEYPHFMLKEIIEQKGINNQGASRQTEEGNGNRAPGRS